MENTNQESSKESSKEFPLTKNLSDLGQRVKRQIEFYFGDANLKRDRWLQNKIREDEGKWLSIDTLLTFNRLKNLTTDKSLILDALETSTLLKVDRENERVRRKVPMAKDQPRDIDCTIFVGGIPLDANLDEIEKAFHTIIDPAKVKYIRMRRRFRSDLPLSEAAKVIGTKEDEEDSESAQKSANAFIAGNDEDDDDDDDANNNDEKDDEKQTQEVKKQPRSSKQFDGTVFVLLASPDDVKFVMEEGSQNLKIRDEILKDIQPMRSWLKALRNIKKNLDAASAPASSGLKRKGVSRDGDKSHKKAKSEEDQDETASKGEEDDNNDKSSQKPFVEKGCIIAINGVADDSSRESFREILDEAVFGLKYVDFSRGDKNARLQFDTTEGAAKALEKLKDAEIAGSKPEKVYILEGDEEEEYFKVLEERRKAIRKNRGNRGNQRGNFRGNRRGKRGGRNTKR